MALSFLYLMTSRLVGMLLGSLRSEHTKDVEIAVLRHQLDVLRRQVNRPEFRPAIVRSWRWSSFLVTPDTIVRWHRRLVTRKWTSPTVEAGGRRIHGELTKLGIRATATTIRTVLLRSGLRPALRCRHPSRPVYTIAVTADLAVLAWQAREGPSPARSERGVSG
jgi:putative transposase